MGDTLERYIRITTLLLGFGMWRPDENADFYKRLPNFLSSRRSACSSVEVVTNFSFMPMQSYGHAEMSVIQVTIITYFSLQTYIHFQQFQQAAKLDSTIRNIEFTFIGDSHPAISALPGCTPLSVNHDPSNLNGTFRGVVTVSSIYEFENHQSHRKFKVNCRKERTATRKNT